MTATLGGDERLAKALIPTFPVGCRRLTPAIGYLESLTQDNVRVVTDEIINVVPNGLQLSTGEVVEVDAIICATGFDVSFCPRFPIVGKNGQNLQTLWKENLPRAYMSSSVSGFPNYFGKYLQFPRQRMHTDNPVKCFSVRTPQSATDPSSPSQSTLLNTSPT
jgi:cation diffusion facilitator CzcD-associated flavoprotein CzcO